MNNSYLSFIDRDVAFPNRFDLQDTTTMDITTVEITANPGPVVNLGTTHIATVMQALQNGVVLSAQDTSTTPNLIEISINGITGVDDLEDNPIMITLANAITGPTDVNINSFGAMSLFKNTSEELTGGYSVGDKILIFRQGANYSIVGRNNDVEIAELETKTFNGLDIPIELTPSTQSITTTLPIVSSGLDFTLTGETTLVDTDLVSSRDFKIRTHAENVFNEILQAGSISGSTGDETASTTAVRTEFLQVEPSKDYKTFIGTGFRINAVAFYEKDKTFISLTTSASEITTPSNCENVRYILTKDPITTVTEQDRIEMQTQFVLSGLAVAPTQFIPYQETETILPYIIGSVPSIADTIVNTNGDLVKTNNTNIGSDEVAFSIIDSDFSSLLVGTNVNAIRLSNIRMNGIKLQDSNINNDVLTSNDVGEVQSQSSFWDQVSSIGKFATTSSQLWFIVGNTINTNELAIDYVRNTQVVYALEAPTTQKLPQVSSPKSFKDSTTVTIEDGVFTFPSNGQTNLTGDFRNSLAEAHDRTALELANTQEQLDGVSERFEESVGSLGASQPIGFSVSDAGLCTWTNNQGSDFVRTEIYQAEFDLKDYDYQQLNNTDGVTNYDAGTNTSQSTTVDVSTNYYYIGEAVYLSGGSEYYGFTNSTMITTPADFLYYDEGTENVPWSTTGTKNASSVSLIGTAQTMTTTSTVDASSFSVIRVTYDVISANSQLRIEFSGATISGSSESTGTGYTLDLNVSALTTGTIEVGNNTSGFTLNVTEVRGVV